MSDYIKWVLGVLSLGLGVTFTGISLTVGPAVLVFLGIAMLITGVMLMEIATRK